MIIVVIPFLLLYLNFSSRGVESVEYSFVSITPRFNLI